MRLPETVTKTKVALINARSLRNKTLLGHDYVDDCSADIVALTETWLRDEDNASVSELCRDIFSFAHQPHGGARRGGGVGVLFRKSFQLVSRVGVDTCASGTVSVIQRNARIDCTTRVIVMYRPPSSCFKTFLDDVSKVLLIAAAMYVCIIKYLKPPKTLHSVLKLKNRAFYLRYKNLVSCAKASSYYACLVIFLFS